MGLAKKSDIPACGRVRRGGKSCERGREEFFTLRAGFPAVAFEFRIASRDPAAERDFRGEQAAEKANQRKKREGEAG